MYDPIYLTLLFLILRLIFASFFFCFVFITSNFLNVLERGFRFEIFKKNKTKIYINQYVLQSK